MLRWALIFLVVAIVAGIFGFRRHHGGGRGYRQTPVLFIPIVIPGFSHQRAGEPDLK